MNISRRKILKSSVFATAALIIPVSIYSPIKSDMASYKPYPGAQANFFGESPAASALKDIRKLQQDLVVYGQACMKTNPDGTLQNIPFVGMVINRDDNGEIEGFTYAKTV